MTKDLICGITVDEAVALSAERDGDSFYFCSQNCRQKFLSPPATATPEEKVQSNAIYTCPMNPEVQQDHDQSVRALGDYYHTVVPGLGLCFRGTGSAALRTGETRQKDAGAISGVVFGSDQGLAGQLEQAGPRSPARSRPCAAEQRLRAIWKRGQNV